jgi:hypothetical protein
MDPTALTIPTLMRAARGEGAHIDPDGNLIRFGSPMQE